MNIFIKAKQKWTSLNTCERACLFCKYVLPPLSAVLTMTGVILMLMAFGWSWSNSGFAPRLVGCEGRCLK